MILFRFYDYSLHSQLWHWQVLYVHYARHYKGFTFLVCTFGMWCEQWDMQWSNEERTARHLITTLMTNWKHNCCDAVITISVCWEPQLRVTVSRKVSIYFKETDSNMLPSQYVWKYNEPLNLERPHYGLMELGSIEVLCTYTCIAISAHLLN